MPLLEVIGVTSTGLTFSIASPLLKSKCENNFVWTSKRLNKLFLRIYSFLKAHS